MEEQPCPILSFQRLRPEMDADIPLPRYMTPMAAGMDIHAALEAPLTLAAGAIRLVPTGFAIALPEGYEAQIRPRSGLAVHHGIGLINSPGTIDADYRGEVKIALINLGDKAFTIHRGDRIAQLLFLPVPVVQLVEVSPDQLGCTTRGTGGIGSTGR